MGWAGLGWSGSVRAKVGGGPSITDVYINASLLSLSLHRRLKEGKIIGIKKKGKERNPRKSASKQQEEEEEAGDQEEREIRISPGFNVSSLNLILSAFPFKITVSIVFAVPIRFPAEISIDRRIGR